MDVKIGYCLIGLLCVCIFSCEKNSESVPQSRFGEPPDIAPFIDSYGLEHAYSDHFDGARYVFDDFKPDPNVCDHVWIERIQLMRHDGDSILFKITDPDIEFNVYVGYRETDSSGADIYIRHSTFALFYLNMNFGIDHAVDWDPCTAGSDDFWWYEFRIWDDDDDLWPDSMDVIYNWAYAGSFWWDRDTFYLSGFWTP